MTSAVLMSIPFVIICLLMLFAAFSKPSGGNHNG